MMNVTAGIAGRYRVKVSNKDGTTKFDSGWFDNLVTTAGIRDALLRTATSTKTCVVGSGTTTPDPSDTWLENQLGDPTTLLSTDYSMGATDRPGEEPMYSWMRYEFKFTEGEVVGTVAEVGLMLTPPDTHLFSRALIKDDAGNPTTVEVTADNQLSVWYESQTYVPSGDIVYGPVEINGTPTTFTLRPYWRMSTTFWAENMWLPNAILQTRLYQLNFHACPDLTDLVDEDTYQTTQNWSTTWSLGSSEDGEEYADYTFRFGTAVDGVDNVPISIFRIYNAASAPSSSVVSGWQLKADPPIVKGIDQEFKFTFRIQLVRV